LLSLACENIKSQTMRSLVWDFMFVLDFLLGYATSYSPQTLTFICVLGFFVVLLKYCPPITFISIN